MKCQSPSDLVSSYEVKHAEFRWCRLPNMSIWCKADPPLFPVFSRDLIPGSDGHGKGDGMGVLQMLHVDGRIVII